LKEHAAEPGQATPMRPRVQYAALPFRQAERLEIMLISSRETGRWVVPKGWPMKGAKPHVVAAVEAMEEAGLLGKISKKPFGAYHYVKRLRNGAISQVRVFPFVAKQRKNGRSAISARLSTCAAPNWCMSRN
jgi:8-oxo-dGTP pyrophosphatase MutT (NUDIX family)